MPRRVSVILGLLVITANSQGGSSPRTGTPRSVYWLSIITVIALLRYLVRRIIL